MPPLIMHAVIILCALSIKHKYPANWCARIYLLVSMRQVERENTRWNLLHPGVLWCTCLASMSQSPHMLCWDSPGRERVHREHSPEVDARLIHISMQMRRCKFKSNWSEIERRRPFWQANDAKRSPHVYQMHAERESRRIAAAGGCNFLVPFMGGARCHSGIFHIYSVYHMLLSRATTIAAGDWRVFIFFFCNSICSLLKMTIPVMAIFFNNVVDKLQWELESMKPILKITWQKIK